MNRLSASILPLLLAFAASSAAQTWNLEHRDSHEEAPLSLWSRSVHGSAYPEYRMELRLRAVPDEVMGAIETNMLDPRTWPEHFERKVLERSPGFVLTYDYISVPLLSDRDAVIRTEMSRDPESGAMRIEWSATQDVGPPPRSGVVRMPRSEGFWHIEGDGKGGSLAVYQSFVDFAGHIPQSMVSSNVEASILEQAGWLKRTLREHRLAQRR